VALKWYVVHVYSGFENKVKKALEERIAASAHPDKFNEVIVPTEQVVETKGGEKVQLEKRIFLFPAKEIPATPTDHFCYGFPLPFFDGRVRIDKIKAKQVSQDFSYGTFARCPITG